MGAPSASLEELREEIALRDRALILLLAERLHFAELAIRRRVAGGHAVTDADQESRVLDRARAWAVECGIPPELAERLFRDLIDRGKAEAESSPSRTRS